MIGFTLVRSEIQCTSLFLLFCLPQDMLSDTLLWLKQKDEQEAAQKALEMEEDEQRAGSFNFLNPSRDQGENG